MARCVKPASVSPVVPCQPPQSGTSSRCHRHLPRAMSYRAGLLTRAPVVVALVLLSMAPLMLGTSEPITPDCAMHAAEHEELRSAASNLTDCILRFVSPTHFCSRCRKERHRMESAYQAISPACQAFKQIRILHDNVLGSSGIWSMSHCDACSEHNMEDFSRRLCHLYKCVNSSFPCNDIVDPLDFFANMSYNVSYCHKCHAQFLSIDAVHQKFTEDCLANSDIVDQFRRLLVFWTRNDCAVYNVSAGFVYVIVLCTLFFPVAFYWLAYLFGAREEDPISELRKEYSGSDPMASSERFDSQSIQSEPAAAAMLIPNASAEPWDDHSDAVSASFVISSRTQSVRDGHSLARSVSVCCVASDATTRRRRRTSQSYEDNLLGSSLPHRDNSSPLVSPQSSPGATRRSRSRAPLVDQGPVTGLYRSHSTGTINVASPVPEGQLESETDSQSQTASTSEAEVFMPFTMSPMRPAQEPQEPSPDDPTGPGSVWTSAEVPRTTVNATLSVSLPGAALPAGLGSTNTHNDTSSNDTSSDSGSDSDNDSVDSFDSSGSGDHSDNGNALEVVVTVASLGSIN
eukprot:m.35306 g.35306  ORF g.35306 m.35306 type:complete len:572 (-) comp10912_c0_seq1:78-1793(-)